MSDTCADVAILTYFFWFARREWIFGSGRHEQTCFGELGGVLRHVGTTHSSSLYLFLSHFFHL